MEKNYIEIIMDLLGNEFFAKLSNDLYLKVNKKYPRIDIKKATEIVESNMAVILIIGIELSRGCIESKLSERVNWYNVCPKSLLIERNIDDIVKKYNLYINIIKKKAIKQ